MMVESCVGKKNVLCLLLFLFPFFGKAEEEDKKVLATAQDTLIFETYKEQMSDFDGDVQALLLETALCFLETPYKAATLEVSDPEKLVINLREMDCTTYLENMLALAYTHQFKGDMDCFENMLRMLRYRDGELDGYLSRLHYFTEWIKDNERKGMVKDVTKACGGELLPLQIDFMSSHADAYKMLNLHPEWVKPLKEREELLSQDSIYYIPKERLESCLDSLCSGDMVAITTHLEGLDVTHVGFVYKDNGNVYLLNASSKERKVIISDELLPDYLNAYKNHSGIIVFRAVEMVPIEL